MTGKERERTRTIKYIGNRCKKQSLEKRIDKDRTEKRLEMVNRV
jgi:hypothetical protein